MTPPKDIAALLLQMPGMERSTRAQRRALASELTAQSLTGRTFIEEGSASKDIYFLLQGQVEVIRALANGERVVVGVLNPPTILGFAGVLHQKTRTASVRARGRVDVLRMDGARGRELLLRDDEVSAVLRRALLIALAKQLATATQLFGQIADHSAELDQTRPAAPVI
ncbi:MAG: cyclic nucleotide-binding domain-containing protein [Oligoflexia bacterium]|nr:cyclic nucleotide-binding domain-containing protein [Oligoflexia bacterium]